MSIKNKHNNNIKSAMFLKYKKYNMPLDQQ
jgi:hypothetical protein